MKNVTEPALRSPLSKLRVLSVQQLHLNVEGLKVKLYIQLCLSLNLKSVKQAPGLLSPGVNSEL